MVWRVSISLPQADVGYFLPLFEAFSESVVYGEDAASSQTQPQVWKIEAYCEEEPNIQELDLKLALTACVHKRLPPKAICEAVLEVNWVDENCRQFPPLTVGSFYIYRSHHVPSPPHGSLSLQLDVATAFGSGEHATTKGCLLALQKCAATDSFQRPLDLGCGSGILAMAIARLWQVEVWAADNDPEAVRVTTLNSEINALHNRIKPLLSEGFANPIFHSCSPFDLVIANILADPLIALASDIDRHTSARACVILSGFLTTQVEAVLKSYTALGFCERARDSEQDWVTLTLLKEKIGG